MKHTKWLLFLLTMAALLVALAACGGDDATQAPQAQATSASAQEPTKSAQAEPTKPQTGSPTKTPEAEETAVEPTTQADEEGDLSTVVSAKDLDSYRSSMKITMSGTKDDKEVEQSIEIATEYTSDPQAQHISMITTSTEELTGTGTIEIYQVEGTQYMNVGGQWMSVPVTDTSSLADSQLISAEDMLNDNCGWNKKGKEDLEGIRVQHYTMDKGAEAKCLQALDIYEQGEITDAGGDIYVAIEGKYVAKMNLFWEGEGLNLFGGTSEDAIIDQGRSEISYAMSDVNERFTIEVPEEALKASSVPEDIPVPPGSEEVTQMFGMITFKTPGTPKEVSDFYAAEMPRNGWTAGDVQEFGGMVTADYTKGARTANFMITEDAASGMTQVLITVQGE